MECCLCKKGGKFEPILCDTYVKISTDIYIHPLIITYINYIYNKTIIYILYIHTGNTVLIHKCKHMHIHDLRKVNVIS